MVVLVPKMMLRIVCQRPPTLTYDQPAKGFGCVQERPAVIGRRQAVPNTFFVVLLLASDEYELHIL